MEQHPILKPRHQKEFNLKAKATASLVRKRNSFKTRLNECLQSRQNTIPRSTDDVLSGELRKEKHCYPKSKEMKHETARRVNAQIEDQRGLHLGR